MFETSRFITYREGRLSIFCFNKDKEYGFLKGYEDKEVEPYEALELSGIADLSAKLPTVIHERFKRGDIRFTVVSGARPQAVGVKKYNKTLDGLRVHPQARNIIQTKLVYGVSDDGELNRLEPDIIKPKPGFEGPFIFDIPEQLDGIYLADNRFAQGKLTLYTSEEPFDRRDDRAALNCISFKSKDSGIIAAYNISELGGALKNHTETEFIYGECECPILEAPDNNLVHNDREHLVKSDISDALIRWVCAKINEVTDKMVERTEREQQQNDLKKSSEFNNFLNSWMNGLLDKLMNGFDKGLGEVLIGTDSGDVGGLYSGIHKEIDNGDTAVNTKGKNGGSIASGNGAGDKKARGQTQPRILLSNFNDDPLNPGKRMNCESTHPLVYQRKEDEQNNIYWINTVAPVARKIRVLEDDGHNSPRWKEYMFQRYVEIIRTQIIRGFLKDNMQVSANDINSKIDEISKEVHKAASNELDKHLYK